MINFFLGVLLCLVIALTIAVVYLIKRPLHKEIPKTAEELRKEEEHKAHYNNMMNYSAEKAYSGGE